MDPLRKASVLRLANKAYDMDLDTVQGVLKVDENGRWRIGDHSLDEIMRKNLGQEVVVIVGSLDDDRRVRVRTCRTCGRDYTDLECPTCQKNRLRFRGR